MHYPCAKDNDQAEHIYQELEASSLATWDEPMPLTMEAILYPAIIERTSTWN
jgi:hypothetical protein